MYTLYTIRIENFFFKQYLVMILFAKQADNTEFVTQALRTFTQMLHKLWERYLEIWMGFKRRLLCLIHLL